MKVDRWKVLVTDRDRNRCIEKFLRLFGYKIDVYNGLVEIEGNEIFWMVDRNSKIALWSGMDFDDDAAHDCGTNVEFAIALAAVDLPTDKYKMFVNDKPSSWVNLGMWTEKGSPILCLVNDYGFGLVGEKDAHVASIHELLDMSGQMNDMYLRTFKDENFEEIVKRTL